MANKPDYRSSDNGERVSSIFSGEAKLREADSWEREAAADVRSLQGHQGHNAEFKKGVTNGRK
jgi:hypothetical protein